jgi:hypothetical protein
MLILILAIVIVLVSWSLRLMQQAIDRHEFSLMLAGTLVAFSAAAMMSVYFLTGNYIGYLTTLPRNSEATPSIESLIWESPSDDLKQTVILPTQSTEVNYTF